MAWAVATAVMEEAAIAGGAGGMGANGEPQAPNWLLRFFDFSVEPGKKYKIPRPPRNARSESKLRRQARRPGSTRLGGDHARSQRKGGAGRRARLRSA